MSPLAAVARRMPRTPRVKTTVCTLAITALGASVARVVLLLNGGNTQPADFILIPAAFTMGVAILHVGHCAEGPTG